MTGCRYIVAPSPNPFPALGTAVIGVTNANNARSYLYPKRRTDTALAWTTPRYWTAIPDDGDITNRVAGARIGGYEMQVLWLIIPDLDRPSLGTCSDYLTPTPYVCLEGESPFEYYPRVRAGKPARRQENGTCKPGSGTFILVPVKSFNLNHDPVITRILRPILVEGTGQLTAAAEITRISPRSTEELAVVRGRPAVVEVAFDDQVQPIRGDLVRAAGPWTSFIDGGVPGDTPFIVTQRGNAGPILSDVEWECPAWSTGSRPRRPVYTATIAELGCGTLEMDQGLALMPRTDRLGQRFLGVSLYGQTFDERTVRLAGPPGAESFELTVRGITVEGALLSERSAALLLRIDRVTYGGEDWCTPGEYAVRRDASGQEP